MLGLVTSHLEMMNLLTIRMEILKLEMLDLVMNLYKHTMCGEKHYLDFQHHAPVTLQDVYCRE